ncbi:MAG: trehalose synthase [Acidimicrobiales bacterium]|nr:trehalose synthase [Acidimicrobiales bacterium]
MRNLTLHRRWRTLIGAICAVLALTIIGAGSQTSAQTTTSQSTTSQTTTSQTTTSTTTSQTTTSQAPTVNPDLQSLEEHSMLFQADLQDEGISGKGVQWREDFGQPEPNKLVNAASVWLLYYPGSVITKPGESVIGTWADPQFWAANSDIGIKLLHTNPTERAGGIKDGKFTPTIDGWFDRIGLDTAPELGTEEDYKKLVANAKQRGAIIAGDLVPLHSGLGPDFWLAARGYKDYVGLYDMVEIDKKDWGLLPQVEDPSGVALVSREAASQLKEKGYIPGIIDSADADPQANTWSGWSATAEVMGADGRPRRSVYLHVFKPAQPAYNWLDPTYAARRVQFGDAARNILDRGVRVLRLDADTFLGLEPELDSEKARDYLTPLANVSTTDIAFMVRKIGGWSYQEFAAPLAQLKEFAPRGPDLSYDFFTRAEALAPLINGDALPLRLGHHFLLDAGVPAGTLIHDLQNHDEITFQLFELGAHDDFQFEGQTLNGKQLKEQILKTMRTSVAGDAAPYNKLYRPEQDGVATTFAGFIAPALGVKDPYHATPEQVKLIQRGHLLVAHANAMIPGVFALSAWDLVGALPVPIENIPKELTAGGDFRWVNRGGVDLLDQNPSATKSAVFGLPKAKALYGPVPEQLKSPDSFASQIKRMLAARDTYRLAEGEMLAVPKVNDRAVCVLVMKLPDSNALAVTALNYGRNNTSVEVDLNNLPGIPAGSTAGQPARDIVADQDAGTVSDQGRLTVPLEGLSGRTIVLMQK